ncbi:MAG: hypothetical protein ACK46X_02915 [Candidatus Sericytochromatia bacterium]
MTRYLPLAVATCLLATACTGGRHVSVIPTNLGAGGANVISAGGGNVISAGGGNVISAGGGNMVGASASKTPAKLPGGANAHGLPTTIRLKMPAPLEAVGVVSAGGANAVSAGGLNHRVQAVPTPDELAARVLASVGFVNGPARMVEGYLQVAAALSLKPGITLTDPDPQGAGRDMAFLLEKKTGYSVLSIGRGSKATGAGQFVGLTFSSPRKGRVVYRTETPGEAKVFLAYDFDLEAGTATSDLAMDTTQEPAGGRIVHGRITFQRDAAKPAPFALTGSLYVHQPELAQQDGVIGFAAAFVPTGQGAYIFGAANEVANQNRFGFLARGGTAFDPDLDAPHDFYMDEAGADLPREKASATLKASVPADSAISRPFPLSPLEADPFESETFRFPE